MSIMAMSDVSILFRTPPNLEKGSIKDAFSEKEIDVLYADFYMKNSIDGRS
ncbi:hypothetical protein AB6G04_08540 [Proteus mirabilis]|uniref:hypothetical protein n=1 Tax=Proteus mirabilis TaxID=584 RepID=UPI0034DDB117